MKKFKLIVTTIIALAIILTLTDTWGAVISTVKEVAITSFVIGIGLLVILTVTLWYKKMFK